jgi:hypothetical protein
MMNRRKKTLQVTDADVNVQSCSEAEDETNNFEKLEKMLFKHIKKQSKGSSNKKRVKK